MADNEIRLVIKSLFEDAGTKKSLGDLRILVEATKQGSKEAADALDQWRNSYGKLAHLTSNFSGGKVASPIGPNMAALMGSGSNFGSPQQIQNALAAIAGKPQAYTGPIPPVIPQPPGGGGGAGGIFGNSTVARAAGGTLGSLFGMGGMGMAAAAGGVAGLTVAGIQALGAAVNKVKDLFQQWFDSIKQIVASALDFELIGTRIESVASKTRQLIIHNKEFAASYERISENVLTVAREIAHLNELQELQLKMQARVADAKLEQELAANALRNRFNPIARIEEEARLREAALQRALDQERKLDEIKAQSFEREAARAKEREAQYAAQAKASKEKLPELERKADADEAKLESISEDTKKKIAEKKKELLLLQPMVEGKSSIFNDAAYDLYRAGANNALNPSSEASGRVSNFKTKKDAEARAEELRKSIEEDERGVQNARDVARQSKAKVKAEERKLEFSEGKVMSLESEAQTATDSAAQQRKVIEEKKSLQDAELKARKGAIESNKNLQILDEATGGRGIAPTGGSASLDPEMQMQTELLRVIARSVSGDMA